MGIRFLSLMVLVAVATGCGVRAQSYVMTKERVDVAPGTGNAGYMAGTPQYLEPQRKTRKVYILELTKPIPESEVRKIEQEITSIATVDTSVHIPQAEAAAPAGGNAGNINIPTIEDDEPVLEHQAPTGPSEATSYTVQKDDTLQKIAKKYYGSYSAWLKIYNANKDKIKNPNFVRPGTVITIPAAE